MKATEIISILFKRDRVLWNLVLAVINIIAGLVFNVAVPLIFAALIIFTAFDCYGYFYLTQDTSYGSEHLVKVAVYRVCQNIVFALLIAILLLLASWHAAAMFVICWWLGFCDYHYYILLRQTDYLKNLEDMPWLWWTPYGIILRMMKKPINSGYLTFFTYLSIIILLIYGFAY
jgi:hypothetical protein